MNPQRPAVRLTFWQAAKRFADQGRLHKNMERAKFGRYVASIGGVLSATSSGEAAWVANYRERGHSGFRNRAWRKHMERSVTPQ